MCGCVHIPGLSHEEISQTALSIWMKNNQQLIKIIPVKTTGRFRHKYCTPYQISGMCKGQGTLHTEWAGLLSTTDDMAAGSKLRMVRQVTCKVRSI